MSLYKVVVYTALTAFVLLGVVFATIILGNLAECLL